MGRTEFLTWNRLRGEPWLVEQKQNLPRERNGALRSARPGAPQKCLTAPTLLETPVNVNRHHAIDQQFDGERPIAGRPLQFRSSYLLGEPNSKVLCVRPTPPPEVNSASSWRNQLLSRAHGASYGVGGELAPRRNLSTSFGSKVDGNFFCVFFHSFSVIEKRIFFASAIAS